MYDHHRRVIERLHQRYEPDPDHLALIVIGSVARDDAREDSDVDCILVVSNEAYARRQATCETAFSADDLCDYPDGHAGGVIVDQQYILDVAARGNEPSRFAFKDARIVFTRLPNLPELLARIPVYQEQERMEKMESFFSQLPVHISYLELGEYSRNPYLLAQTTTMLVLFGGRLILAHNRRLYPSRKWFMRELRLAPDKPAGMLELAQALLECPSIAKAFAFYELIVNFQEWPQPKEGVWQRFRRDSELNWRNGRPPLCDS